MFLLMLILWYNEKEQYIQNIGATMEKKDRELIGNEIIEEKIKLLQENPTDEQLAVTLTAIRKRMNEGAKVIVSVEASAGSSMQMQVMQLEDKSKWLVAYTSFDEELKGSNPVMSTFMANMGKLFQMAIQENTIQGVILNPWNRTIMLDRMLLQIIMGKQ